MNTLIDLATTLYDADAEGKAIAGGLLVKATEFGPNIDPVTGHDWGSKGPPSWHPANPKHQFHDAYLEQGNMMYARDAGGGHPGEAYHAHPLNDRPAAEERASVARADASIVHPSNRPFVENPMLDSPIHPDHAQHDLYLANPAWMHGLLGHHMEGVNRNWMETAHGKLAAGRNHPTVADHPDRDHFLAAHAANQPFRVGERYQDNGGVSVSSPYTTVMGSFWPHANNNPMKR